MVYDVAVLGTGLAGMCAALAAREEGATVALAGAGPGTLHLASGCIDVMAYPPGLDGKGAREPVADPMAAVVEVARSLPEHPYAAIGAERVAATLPWLARHAAVGGWPMEGAGSANRAVLTAVGRFRSTCLVPASYAAGADLTTKRPLLIVGIAGLRDFSAPMLAKVLGHRGYRVRSEVIEGLPTGFQGHALGLTRFLKDRGAIEIGERIRSLVRPGELAGIPPILPPFPDVRFFEQLRRAAGAEVFEIPTLPPSLPGIRLAKALRARCLTAGVDLWEGVRAVGFESKGGSVTHLLLVAGPAPRRIAARAFVLATGSYLSGGIRVDGGSVTEPLFGLPVEGPPMNGSGKRVPLFSQEFLSPAGHAAGKLGLAVDEELRPARREGGRMVAVWENLFAAGDLLAGHNPLVERSGGGVASASGRVAGSNAAQAAGCAGERKTGTA